LSDLLVWMTVDKVNSVVRFELHVTFNELLGHTIMILVSVRDIKDLGGRTFSTTTSSF
jgi:hypothetical protein